MNEKTFYKSFHRQQNQGGKFFQATKKTTIDSFMKNRLKSAKETTSEEALTQSTQQTHKRDRKVLE